MSSHHRKGERTIARESYALAFAAPEVIARRMMQMWLAGITPSQRDRAELHRMFAEKIAAFCESWNAMLLEMFRASARIALSSMWSPWTAATSNRGPRRLLAQHRRAMAGIVGAGIAPVRRRAVANVRRLRRARR